MSELPTLTFAPAGDGAVVDLEQLIRSRMLIQANSGGGKSYCLRYLLEQTHGHVQHLVLDPEGEFGTLRAVYPYVLAGREGDVPATPETAALLCRRLMELGASGIIDLYDLPPQERRRYVRLFLEELMALPRDLWRPCLVVIDEAHVYCMDEETEILTADGWKRHDQVEIGTIAVTFSPEKGSYQEDAIQRVIKRDHSGEMVRLASDGIDCLVTDDHRVVLRRYQRAQGRRKVYDWTYCPASDVPTHFHVPAGGAPLKEGVPGLDEQMCHLLGWIITDGHFTGGNRKRYLSIEQAVTTTKGGVSMCETLTSLLESFGSVTRYERAAREHPSFGRTHVSKESVSFYLGLELSREVMKWTGTEIHRIPRVILQNGSPAQLKALFRGLMEGDGTQHAGKWRAFYPGKNQELADEFQELCIRLGISATKRLVPKQEQWAVLLSRRTHHYIRKASREVYKGLVWDITVPSGAFVVRRKGKVFVTGNCPERGTGEAESTSAVITLASQGRKRGFCLIAATQRLSKVHKDVAAELGNKLIGRTTLDVDLRRAADDLGFSKDRWAELRSLSSGQFFAYGPAISDQVQLVQTGEVVTQHPQAGAVASASPPPPEALRELLAQLADLPSQAAQEARSTEELRAEIVRLQTQLRERPSAERVVERVEVPVVPPGLTYQLAHVGSALLQQARGVQQFLDYVQALKTEGALEQMDPDALDRIRIDAPVEIENLRLPDWEFPKNIDPATAMLVPPEALGMSSEAATSVGPTADALREVRRPTRSLLTPPSDSPNGGAQQQHPTATPAGTAKLRAGERRILEALASMHPLRVTEAQLGLLAKLTPSGGTWNGYWTALKSAGRVEKQGTLIGITEAGFAALGRQVPPAPATPLERLALYKRLLKPGPRKMLEVLAHYRHGLTRDDLASRVLLTASGGTFGSYLGTLRQNELVEDADGFIRISNRLFETGG